MTRSHGTEGLRPLSEYKLLIFDCDGVILDSNAVKTDAFRSLAMQYGKEVAERFVKYHQDNGGISRYVKLHHLLSLAGLPQEERRLNQLLDAFAVAVREGLMTCPIADGLDELKAVTPNARWAVASGSDQTELREVLGARGLSRMFDAGIHGSPVAKIDIVQRLIVDCDTSPAAALMLGDSRLDHEAARASGIDFVFVSSWTEYADWQIYVASHHLRTVATVDELLPSFSASAS